MNVKYTGQSQLSPVLFFGCCFLLLVGFFSPSCEHSLITRFKKKKKKGNPRTFKTGNICCCQHVFSTCRNEHGKCDSPWVEHPLHWLGGLSTNFTLLIFSYFQKNPSKKTLNSAGVLSIIEGGCNGEEAVTLSNKSHCPR